MEREFVVYGLWHGILCGPVVRVEGRYVEEAEAEYNVEKLISENKGNDRFVTAYYKEENIEYLPSIEEQEQFNAEAQYDNAKDNLEDYYD